MVLSVLTTMLLTKELALVFTIVEAEREVERDVVAPGFGRTRLLTELTGTILLVNRPNASRAWTLLVVVALATTLRLVPVAARLLVFVLINSLYADSVRFEKTRNFNYLARIFLLKFHMPPLIARISPVLFPL